MGQCSTPYLIVRLVFVLSHGYYEKLVLTMGVHLDRDLNAGSIVQTQHSTTSYPGFPLISFKGKPG